MTTRAEKLADRIREGANAIIEFAENCTDDEWETLCDNENRSVGTLIHHVASAYVAEQGAVKALSKGNGLVGVTWEAVNQGNANHAEHHENPDKAETIALLKTNSEDIAVVVSALSDEQLDTVGPLSLNKDAPLTMQFFIEDHPIAHPYYHLASIKEALNK